VWRVNARLPFSGRIVGEQGIAEDSTVAANKKSVKAVVWPSSNDAQARIDALRMRDAEIGELVRDHDGAARIEELEKQVRYLKAFSIAERAKNPWWVVMQVRYVIRAVIRRYLKR
jgi:hypothetical protein